MAGFTLLEHTADVGIRARGSSLAEALSWVAAGMFSLIVDPDTVTSHQSQEVLVISRDRETLVVDWRNELLYRYETTGFLLKECRISLEREGTCLRAICHGERTDPARHHILTVIKAATYHRVAVTHDGGWTINVILDV